MRETDHSRGANANTIGKKDHHVGDGEEAAAPVP